MAYLVLFLAILFVPVTASADPITAGLLFAVQAGVSVGALKLVAGFAGSLILGALSSALTPKPRGAGLVSSAGTVALKQPILSSTIVYGHTRVTRGYAQMESTGVNGTLHLIIMLGEGEFRAINEVWANDYAIPNDWIDADGNVTQGRYAGYMTIRKHLGSASQLADSMAVLNMPGWTNNHRLQGIAYLYITLTKNQDIYPTGVPNFSAIVEGKTLYDPRVDGFTWSPNIALFCYDYLQNPDYGYGILQDDISLTNVAAQANICDEIVDTEFKDYQLDVVDVGTDIITLDGDYLQLEYGDRIEVISTGTLPGGLTSDPYYVIPYQIANTPRIRLAETLEDAFAKNYVDITSSGSGEINIRKTGEPRYHGAGVIDTEVQLSQNLNNLASSMAGRAINTGGYWTLLAGAWRSPSVTLGIGDIRSSIGFKSNLSMAESYNSVKGVFIGQVNQYQESDYPAAFYPQFIQDDNGIPAPKEINLEFTSRPTTAQRIAKIELFRGRQDIVYTCDFSTKALQLQPGDTVMLDIDRLGWESKIFEVTQFGFNVIDDALTVRLVLRETAQAIYDWSQGEAITYDPAPNTNLPDPFSVSVPDGFAYDARSVVTTASDTLFVMKLKWNLHPDAFVREYGDIEVQFKPSSETVWLPSFFVDGKLTETDAFSASAGASYDLRIRAMNNVGVRSGWATIFNAFVGSSGGVTINNDWDFVYNSVSVFNDWGGADEAIGSGDYEDWGFVN